MRSLHLALETAIALESAKILKFTNLWLICTQSSLRKRILLR